MAKFKAEYESGISVYTLTFRDKEFSFAMIPDEDEGYIMANRPSFSKQLSDEFDLAIEELEEYVDIDRLGCFSSDSDEILEVLERLEDYEWIDE